jgi:hypothetical protein
MLPSIQLVLCPLCMLSLSPNVGGISKLRVFGCGAVGSRYPSVISIYAATPPSQFPFATHGVSVCSRTGHSSSRIGLWVPILPVFLPSGVDKGTRETFPLHKNQATVVFSCRTHVSGGWHICARYHTLAKRWSCTYCIILSKRRSL